MRRKILNQSSRRKCNTRISFMPPNTPHPSEEQVTREREMERFLEAGQKDEDSRFLSGRDAALLVAPSRRNSSFLSSAAPSLIYCNVSVLLSESYTCVRKNIVLDFVHIAVHSALTMFISTRQSASWQMAIFPDASQASWNETSIKVSRMIDCLKHQRLDCDQSSASSALSEVRRTFRSIVGRVLTRKSDQ